MLETSEENKKSNTNEPMIPLSEVSRLIQIELDKRQASSGNGGFNAKEFTKSISELISRDSTRNGEYSVVGEGDIDPDDVLKEPVVFWCTGHSHSIFSENRKGHNVRPPFNRPIRFEHSYTDVTGVGSNKSVIKVGVYSAFSKKVAEWLRGSIEYGVRFFENVSSVAKIDMYFANKLAEAARSISALDNHQLMQRAQLMGIVITQDFANVKQQVIQKIAEEEARKNSEIQRAGMVPSDANRERVIVRGTSANVY